MTTITEYHAHIYYDPPQHAEAKALCDRAGQMFGVRVGRMHDNPVGPHPRGSCQLTVPADCFADIVPWLALNREGFTVFVHPQTGNALQDHTAHVIWLGPSETLKLGALS